MNCWLAEHANFGHPAVTLSSSRHRALTLTLVASLFFASCSPDPNVRKQKYFQSGQRYATEGKYREAEVEFLNAIKVDSSFAEAPT